MYSCGPPHMDVQKQDDQHELTYSNYVRTRDVALKTCRRRWMIGRSGEKGSGISVLAARHDDDDDDSCCLSHHVYDQVNLWPAVITGDTVTRLSIPIRVRGKSPEEGQSWNLAETLWKKKQHNNKKLPRWGQKVRNK